MTVLRIGTRGSRLALWQTQWVMERLRELHPNLSVEIVTIKTSGEKDLHADPNAPLVQPGSRGMGVFTDEIETALLDGRIDLAVHSLKDLASELPQGLVIGAYCVREDPRDVLVSTGGLTFAELPPHSLIGTSSLRRVAQVLHLRPDLRCVDMRGNVDTRLRRLEESSELSAIILAAAGIIRLGFTDRITQYFDDEVFLPAPGQGVIAVEISAERDDLRELTAKLNHQPSEYEVRCERSFLSALKGGCRLPVGARAIHGGDTIRFRGMVASIDGTQMITTQISGTDPESLGRQAAQDVLDRGATQILEAIRQSDGQSHE